MFGDLMGNMEEKKEQLQERLAGTEMEEVSADQSIKIKFNGLREILDVSVDMTKIDTSDSEQLEDLLLITLNKVNERIAILEEEENKKMLKDILPSGLGGLGNLFG